MIKNDRKNKNIFKLEENRICLTVSNFLTCCICLNKR